LRVNFLNLTFYSHITEVICCNWRIPAELKMAGEFVEKRLINVLYLFFCTTSLILILSMAGPGNGEKNLACQQLCGKFLQKQVAKIEKKKSDDVPDKSEKKDKDGGPPKGLWSKMGPPPGPVSSSNKDAKKANPEKGKGGNEGPLWNSIVGQSSSSKGHHLIRKKRVAKPYEPPPGVHWDEYDLTRRVEDTSKLHYFGNGWNPLVREAQLKDHDDFLKTHDCSGVKKKSQCKDLGDYPTYDNTDSDEPVPPFEWAPYDYSGGSLKCTTILCPTDRSRRSSSVNVGWAMSSFLNTLSVTTKPKYKYR